MLAAVAVGGRSSLTAVAVGGRSSVTAAFVHLHAVGHSGGGAQQAPQLPAMSGVVLQGIALECCRRRPKLQPQQCLLHHDLDPSCQHKKQALQPPMQALPSTRSL